MARPRRVVIASWHSRTFRRFLLASSLVLGASGAWIAAVLVSTQHLRYLPPYPMAGQLFTVLDGDSAAPRDLPGPAFVRWREAVAARVDVAAYRRQHEVLIGEGAREYSIEASLISVNLLETIGISPALGRSFQDSDATENGDVVLVGWNLAVRLFGSQHSALGQLIVVDGRPRRVVGVMARGFWFPTVTTELWMPLRVVPFFRSGNRVSIPYYTPLARLPEELPAADATRILRDVTVRAAPRLMGSDALTLADVGSTWYRTERQAAQTVAVFTVMLWLSAVFSGFLIGTTWWASSSRVWEVAWMLGARSWHLAAELLSAWFYLTAGAWLVLILVTMVAVHIGFGPLPAANAYGGAAVVDFAWLLGAMVAGCLVTAVIGPVTGWSAARSDRMTGWQTVPGPLPAWSSIAVAGQISAGIAGIVVTVALTTAMDRFVGAGYGFRGDSETQVLSLRMRRSPQVAVDRRAQAFDLLQRELTRRAHPTAVGLTDRPPYQIPALRSEIAVSDPAGVKKEFVGVRLVSDGYFAAVGTDLLANVPQFTQVARGLVLSESLARWAGVKPGGVVVFADQLWRVDAIADDIRQPGADASLLTVYVPFRATRFLPTRLREDGLSSVSIIVGEGTAPGTMEAARQVIDEVLGASAAITSTTTMADALISLAPQLGLGLRLGRAFTVISAAIALCALVGTWLRGLRTRRREVGVRLALGASGARVLREETARAARIIGPSTVAAGCILAIAWPHITSQLPALVFPAPLSIAGILAAVLVVCAGVVSVTTLLVIRHPVRSLLRSDSGGE